MITVYQDDAVTLLHGDTWEWLASGEACDVDAVITDPPYSERVEKGFRSGSDVSYQCGMGYEPLTESQARSLACNTASLARGWVVICGDHITMRWYEEELAAIGRYVFPPIPLVKTKTARMAGDGPPQCSEWMMVARPRSKAFLGAWKNMEGWYYFETVRHGHGYVGVRGCKSLALMRAIVRDYTRPGDLVLDPFCGSGTTALACRMEGRRCITIERDPATVEIAHRRLSLTPLETARGQMSLLDGVSG